MGKREDQVWPLLEVRTRPNLCEIAKTRSFWEKEQRSTRKDMEGQHKGRHEEIQLTEDIWHKIENTGELSVLHARVSAKR